MTDYPSRRQWLAASGVAAGAVATGFSRSSRAAEDEQASRSPFRYCLNTSTIRGQGLSLPDEIDLAAKAGYDGIEPWIRKIESYVQSGGKLADLRKRLADHGLAVESAIGFAAWIVDDPEQRKAGLEQAKRDMALVRDIGGRRIAAPPAGAHAQEGLDLVAAGKRYRDLLELGASMDVVPQLEFWGPARSLNRLSQAAFIALEAGHPQACLLPDVYHMFRGGSDFHGLKLISGNAIHVFHVNDYPAEPARDAQNDGHRVYPGDGVAPFGQIIRDLAATGCRAALSLELFNRDYWKQDAFEVTKTGLEKTREVVERGLA